jgi:hypothetical protein
VQNGKSRAQAHSRLHVEEFPTYYYSGHFLGPVDIAMTRAFFT